MQYRWPILVAALATVALTGGALLGSVVGPDAQAEAPTPERLVSPHEGDGYVWPYTSPTRSVADRTLAVNVVVRGDPARVRRVLEDRSEANWSDVERQEVEDVTNPAWAPARGAARYTYVAGDSGEPGRWVESTYQLAVGSYLGRRTHVRAYSMPGGNWTAMQAHTEYWDWFRLRHTVTGVEPGARFVERDLRDEPSVATVSREYHGLDGGGSDGWLTVIEVVPATVAVAALPVAVLPVTVRRRALTDLALPVALAAILLGVRSVGVAAEGLFPSTDPKLFVALLYPVLAAGPPVVVGALARDRGAERAALLAAAGLGAGIVLDLGAVGVAVVPVRLVLHRVALVATLALLAFGVARADRRTVAAGLVGWVAALAAALLGVV